MGFFVRMYMRISAHKAVKNASIRGKKTHVYRVAGMIASIRGKIPHVYRVIILKQMAYHMLDPARLNAFSFYAPVILYTSASSRHAQPHSI